MLYQNGCTVFNVIREHVVVVFSKRLWAIGRIKFLWTIETRVRPE